MAEKYDWFYRHASAGEPLMQLLLHEDPNTVVGTCAAGQRRMLRAGHEIRSGVLVDLTVLPAHRSLGPALILQRSMFDAARMRLDALYCFPNPKAAPVFMRIGYQHLGEMVRHVRVLRHAPYLQRSLRKKLPDVLSTLVSTVAGAAVDLSYRIRDHWRWSSTHRLRAQWHDRVPDIEAIWNASPKPQALTAIRDAAYLRWRFDAAPNTKFRHLLLHEADTPIAWFATRDDNRTLQIHDFWSRDDGATPRPVIIAALLNAARRAGFAAVCVELATTTERLAVWRALGFVARSRRPIFGRYNTEQEIQTGTTEDAFDLHLTSADEDE